eukprot:Selendium_serpulae@DN10673_c0_g1_i1.p1
MSKSGADQFGDDLMMDGIMAAQIKELMTSHGPEDPTTLELHQNIKDRIQQLESLWISAAEKGDTTKCDNIINAKEKLEKSIDEYEKANTEFSVGWAVSEHSSTAGRRRSSVDTAKSKSRKSTGKRRASLEETLDDSAAEEPAPESEALKSKSSRKQQSRKQKTKTKPPVKSQPEPAAPQRQAFLSVFISSAQLSYPHVEQAYVQTSVATKDALDDPFAPTTASAALRDGEARWSAALLLPLPPTDATDDDGLLGVDSQVPVPAAWALQDCRLAVVDTRSGLPLARQSVSLASIYEA